MKMKYLKGFIAITLLLFVTVSCEDFSLDLKVDNFEHPNDEILTSDPVALEATAIFEASNALFLISSTFA